MKIFNRKCKNPPITGETDQSMRKISAPEEGKAEIISANGTVISGTVLARLRNAIHHDSTDGSEDGLLESMTNDEMFHILLEYMGIYGKTELIMSLIKGLHINESITFHGQSSIFDDAFSSTAEKTQQNESEYLHAAPPYNEEELTEHSEELSELLECEAESVDLLLQIIHMDGHTTLHTMSGCSVEEDREILQMLVDANRESAIQHPEHYLEMCGALLGDGSIYNSDDVYFKYDAQKNILE